MEKAFKLQIQTTYNQLTKAEKKVADYVLNNQQKVLYMSITDLADACKVGDTSVYRFCRTMKLQGYQEFKVKLSLSMSQEEEVDVHKTEKNMAQQIMELNISAIKETYALLEMDKLEQALELFTKAKRVYFYGVGDSLLTAQGACNKFTRIVNKVICISDSHMQAMAAATSAKTDFFIIISYSGASKDSILVAKLAKEAGAKVVCISHYLKSPLASYSDVLLLCGADEDPLDGGSMTGKMGQLYLMDLLYQEYYSRNYNECRKNNEQTSSAVFDKLY